jgi:hypothetical protein
MEPARRAPPPPPCLQHEGSSKANLVVNNYIMKFASSVISCIRFCFFK